MYFQGGQALILCEIIYIPDIQQNLGPVISLIIFGFNVNVVVTNNVDQFFSNMVLFEWFLVFFDEIIGISVLVIQYI